jgi:hypothetical protein
LRNPASAARAVVTLSAIMAPAVIDLSEIHPECYVWARVKNFHAATLEALSELVAVAGLDHPNEFAPAHFSRRVSPR